MTQKKKICIIIYMYNFLYKMFDYVFLFFKLKTFFLRLFKKCDGQYVAHSPYNLHAKFYISKAIKNMYYYN